MTSSKIILITDDNKDLRDQLVRLVRQVSGNWQIIEADSFITAIEKIDTNKINILVSDLYLEPNEELNKDKYSIPSGIKLAKYFREKQPDSFIYIVTNYLNSLVSRNQLIEYIDIGVNDFLDRNVNPFEKFSQKFKYQLQILDQSIIQINRSSDKVWKAQDIKTHKSFWILILDLKDKKYSDLIADFTIWEKNLPEPGAAFLLLDIYNSKTSYLEENKILNNVSFSYPILLISDNYELQDVIKIASQTLDLIRSKNELDKLLYIIHKKLVTGTTIHELKNEIQIPKFWDWLPLGNIKGFDLESGLLEQYMQPPAREASSQNWGLIIAILAIIISACISGLFNQEIRDFLNLDLPFNIPEKIDSSYLNL